MIQIFMYIIKLVIDQHCYFNTKKYKYVASDEVRLFLYRVELHNPRGVIRIKDFLRFFIS